MPYELLYTRSISSDDRVRFTDVPITSPSIMVDVLSLRSPFYRIAGYAYSIVSDGLIDYERGAGYTLPFGKNRLLFPSTVLPYYLEFFPKWGTKQAIISVYTGTPSPAPPSVPIPGTSDRVYRSAATGEMMLSRGPGQAFVSLGWTVGFAAWAAPNGKIYIDNYQPNRGVSEGPLWAFDQYPDFYEYGDFANSTASVLIPIS